MVLYFSIISQLFLRCIGERHYSLFNIILFLYTIFYNQKFLPISICSSISTFTTFYGLVLYDINAINRLRIHNGYSIPFFIFGDFILHVLPIILIYFKYWRIAVNFMHESQSIIYYLSGLTSLFIHLLWFHLNDNLNDIYIPLTNGTWILMWNIAILGHLITMNSLYFCSELQNLKDI